MFFRVPVEFVGADDFDGAMGRDVAPATFALVVGPPSTAGAVERRIVALARVIGGRGGGGDFRGGPFLHRGHVYLLPAHAADDRAHGAQDPPAEKRPGREEPEPLPVLL